jgi:polyisoprenoid-binding protein YceI
VNQSRWRIVRAATWRLPCAAGGAALIEVALLAQLAAQTLTPAPLARGEIAFAMHAAIIGAFTGRAPIARAEFTGNRLADVRGMAEVRVAEMRTGIALRDRHLREAMTADSFPTVRFDLVEVQPGSTSGDTTTAAFEGRLTLDGVTRAVHARGTVVTTPAGVDVEATFPIDMRDYGIVPPVRAIVLRVAPDVVVTARLSFRAAAGP